MRHRCAYGFVDGGYLRKGAQRGFQCEFLNPQAIVWHSIREGGFGHSVEWDVARVLYYDAEPDGEDPTKVSVADQQLQKYFARVEALPDTECRFGYIRGRPSRKGRQQKAVDVQLTVDLLVRAFDRLCDLAVLIAGDADYVPLVHEAKRRGVQVIVAGFDDGSINELLETEADRCFRFPQDFGKFKLPVD